MVAPLDSARVSERAAPLLRTVSPSAWFLFVTTGQAAVHRGSVVARDADPRRASELVARHRPLSSPSLVRPLRATSSPRRHAAALLRS